jgi:hypothetical protein
VENYFGILANRFRVFYTYINMRPKQIDYIVLASCVLHSFLRERAKSSYRLTGSVKMEDSDTGALTAGDTRQLKPSDGLQGHGARDVCQEAKRCGLQYESCVMNEGQVTGNKFLLLAISSLQESTIRYPITTCIQHIYQ